MYYRYLYKKHTLKKLQKVWKLISAYNYFDNFTLYLLQSNLESFHLKAVERFLQLFP